MLRRPGLRSLRSVSFLGSAFVLCATVLPGALAGPGDRPELELGGRSLDEFRTLVLPCRDERAAEAIPWIPSFSGGLREAGTRDKPLLLWLMNGHPLGCT